jgi:tetratricopeptide (TPR) repeat protein
VSAAIRWPRRRPRHRSRCRCAKGRATSSATLEKAWDGYFPLGEELDLANGIAALLYAMDDYPRALAFFQISMLMYDPDTVTLYSVAACFQRLGEDEAAAARLRKVLEYDPGNEPARMMLAECEEAASRPEKP